jgi:hypothetical protein
MSRGFRLSRPPTWRVLLLAGLVWLLGSALFAPGLNPLTRWVFPADIEVRSMLGLFWQQAAMARADAADFWDDHKAWPENARALYQPDDNGLIALDMPAEFVLRYTFTKGFPPESGLRDARVELRFDPASRSWSCRPGTPAPPNTFLPSDCRPTLQSSAPIWLLSALLIAVLVLIALLLWLGLFDPRQRALRQQPRRLRRQPVRQLSALDRQLRLLRRREAALQAAEIAPEDWREALRFGTATPAEQAQALALRIGARSLPSSGWSLPGEVFEWQLPNSLPLALERALLYLPPATLPARDLVRHLRGVSTGQDVLLVLSPDPRCDAALLAYSSDPANLCVGFDQSSISEWLLHPAPQEPLLAQLSRQLKITRISPYQTRGGVTRPGSFFGRTQLLAQVLNREPGNYLLVGGRQLGKTSLMKAIERRFDEHPRVQCLYFSLRDHRLGARLAAELELPLDTGLDISLRALAARAGQRRLLLLLDETDLFLREDARAGYAQLASLRALSEEGVCHFMLAGFWDLYEATSLDFASPIRNFGEVIRLGALEAEACVALATEPLRRLGIGFESPALVARLVDECGQRANLVAMVCQYGLEQLERGERVISADTVERALGSDSIADALGGWSRLSPDPAACALDRSLVYRVAQQHLQAQPPLTMAQWLAELDAAGARAEPEAVRRSFARLQLAWVLLREDSGEGWRFAVPVQARQFHPGEVDALLGRELQGLAA